jgi:uncharacterized protein YcfJ
MSSTRKSLVASGIVLATVMASLLPVAAYAQESYTGNVVGGIAGALLGNRIGGGNGRIAATAAGGIIGAIVGGNVERGSSYRQLNSPPQQTYYNSYPQSEPQYQTRYNPVIYARPAYVQPVYEQQTYIETQQEPAYVYVERDHGRNSWRERDHFEHEHREWHQDHDGRDNRDRYRRD